MTDIKDYLLHNDREAYSELLLKEIKSPENDAARLQAVNDYVKANNGKDDKIAALTATIRALPAADREKLAADAKQDMAKTLAGQQKVRHRQAYEENEAKETFDFNVQKYAHLYQSLTGKEPDMDALVAKAADKVTYKDDEKAQAAADIRKNLSEMNKTDAHAPAHMIASYTPEKAQADLVGILSSYESQKRGRAKEAEENKEYIAYITARQKAVCDIIANASDNKMNAAVMNKLKGNAR